MKIKKILVANRGEIAIRVLRACTEINLKTVAIFTYEDRYSQHRYKADESYQIGENNQPLKPYLDIDEIIGLAKSKNVDAIHPGYGFLSENSDFARKCAKSGIIFIGPNPEVMDALGDKITAKKNAEKCNVPVIEGNKKKLSSLKIALSEASEIGYPLMLKAASGGGGRGMRIVRNVNDLKQNFDAAKNESLNAFGDDTMFLEKYVEDPKHIEVQIVADNHGNIRHLYERDCSVQRRHQKVVEIAPSFNISEEVKQNLYKYALAIAKQVSYNNIGTVEFLVDKTDQVYFIEVNPRIQVEHTVTEMVTGIDLVKTQIFVAGGYKLSDTQIKINEQGSIVTNGFALQCRLTTEDPENNFTPDYGTITTYRSASGMGIRLDAGSIYQSYKVSPFFDSMLVKVSAQGRTLDGAVRKMTRALKEFRIRGVKTNIYFLQNVIQHSDFKEGKATVNFIQKTPELFKIRISQDRSSKILNYLGEVIVNGNPDVKFIEDSKVFRNAKIPAFNQFSKYPKGTKDLLTELGPDSFSKWLRDEKKIHYTDTTIRDAHQSLLATRMRTYDMLKVAESFAKNHANTFSIEMWGGATFDVCLRFLHESPWSRLRDLRKAMPNILFQMLLRGSNAVGYKAYPDNLIEKFVDKSWENGIDIFRIFDSLNWVKAMEPSIKYVRNTNGALAEAAISYTGNILDTSQTKYNLNYYTQLAKDLENAGAHIIALKDMAGLLTPYAATELIGALRDTVKLPIHLHTHDTSSLQSATYLKAIEANVDVVDVALGGLSGLTSQPNFNSIVEMMKYHERAHKFDMNKLNQFSNYWEDIREYYYPFESGLKSGTAEVYQHEIPGGQYSNLRPQATALGLGGRFDEVKKIITYAQLYQVSTIDTAISYGDSEVSMGKIGVNEWKIVTKLPKIPETCESVDSWISDNIQKSLSRLNVTKIEAILLHNPMQLLGKNGVEIWSSLRHHQSLGIVNKVGFSIYDPIELDKLYFQFKPDVVQFPYNVLDRRIETSKWLRRLRNDKVETHARSVFLQGLLLMNKNNRPKKFSQWEDIWLLWDNFLSKKNITAMHACIGFVLLNKNIDKIVVGVDSKNQLQEILDFDNNIICLDDFVRLTSNDVDLINPSRWGEG